MSRDLINNLLCHCLVILHWCSVDMQQFHIFQLLQHSRAGSHPWCLCLFSLFLTCGQWYEWWFLIIFVYYELTYPNLGETSSVTKYWTTSTVPCSQAKSINFWLWSFHSLFSSFSSTESPCLSMEYPLSAIFFLSALCSCNVCNILLWILLDTVKRYVTVNIPHISFYNGHL